MNEYQYDVFISYKRSTLIEPWVRVYFLDLFSDWLTEKLLILGLPAPQVFFDQKKIEAGMNWPLELQNAIKASKVLVAICSPTYFASRWCQSEWETFKSREAVLNLNSLRIPVRHNDCEQHLQNIHFSDFYGLTFPVKDFYQSSQAVDFYNKVEELAETVANAIKNAPPFDPNWPIMNVNPPSPSIPIQRL